MKKIVVVIFGGQSPEHDVSILSGLQVLESIDRDLFLPLPVYIDPEGRWFSDEKLLKRSNYLFRESELNKMKNFFLRKNGVYPELVESGGVLYKKKIRFDIAFPVLHGSCGENGCIQGMLELLGIPYTGMTAKASSLFMDKEIAKRLAASHGIPVLPYKLFQKPIHGSFVNQEEMQDIKFPCCVKPANLGSSICVSIASDTLELQTALCNIFQFDDKAIVEPFLDDVIEYNVSVTRTQNNEVIISSIEQMTLKNKLLAFKDKYSGKNLGSKLKTPQHMTEHLVKKRDINPQIDSTLLRKMHDMAETIFCSVDQFGAPRLDFLKDANSSDIWFNELNPIPGSYAYYLWENSTHKMMFTELTTHLINHAYTKANVGIPKSAELFQRKN